MLAAQRVHGQTRAVIKPLPSVLRASRCFAGHSLLASGKLALLPDFEPSKKPVWASVAPDDSVVVFARGHNLYMIDAANYEKAKKNPADASVVETQITTDGEEHFGYDKRLNDDDRKALKKDSKDDKNKAGQRVPSIVGNFDRVTSGASRYPSASCMPESASSPGSPSSAWASGSRW